VFPLCGSIFTLAQLLFHCGYGFLSAERKNKDFRNEKQFVCTDKVLNEKLSVVFAWSGESCYEGSTRSQAG